MNIKQICLLALDYSGEKYISHIVKNEMRYIVSFCDEAGHDLFIAPISIDANKGVAEDYSAFDDSDNHEYTDVDVPEEYLSKKGRLFNAVVLYGNYGTDYIKILDIIYEKYDLYNEDPAIAFSVLNYYLSIVEDFEDTSISGDAYDFVIDDDRTIDTLREECRDFCYVPEIVKRLQDVLEELLVQSYNKSMNSEMIGQDQLIERAQQLIGNADISSADSYIFGDKDKELLEELKRNIDYECKFIDGKNSVMSALLEQRIKSIENHDNNDNMFGNTQSFTNQKFQSEGE